MFDVAGSLGIFEKIVKGGKSLYQLYRKNPAFYLKGSLTSGLEIAYRIIALFEAHGVKRTQIYQLLGNQFPFVTPAIEAEKLQNSLSGELIKTVSSLFAVRQEWVEGEDGRIYNPLIHYKNLGGFVQFVRELKARNHEDQCFLYAYKGTNISDGLYVDDTQIELAFAEPRSQIGDKIICRYFPVYGPLPWAHNEARYHLSAFFNVIDNTKGFVMKGYSVQPSVIGKIGSGETIPSLVKVKRTWHPEDFWLPVGSDYWQVKPRRLERCLTIFS